MIDARIRLAFPQRPDSQAFSLDLHLRTSAPTTVLFGPSGSGKSLTLDSIAGFAHPTEGRILVDDVLLFDAAARVNLPPRARHCGYVFQASALFPHLTLRQNLAFAAATLPRLERTRKVNETLEQFHLAEAAGRLPSELSGGQRQRGSIARALLAQPRLLLLDEPSSGLDHSLREELYALLAQVRADFRLPILLVTHHLDEAIALGDELFVLKDGRILQSGPPAAVLDQPAGDHVATLLGRFNLLDAEILSIDPSHNRSRLRCFLPGVLPFEIDAPYFPGHLLGARLRLVLRHEEIAASSAPGSVPFRLNRLSRRAGFLRAEFAGGLVAEIPERGFSLPPPNAPWFLHFPPESLRLLK